MHTTRTRAATFVTVATACALGLSACGDDSRMPPAEAAVSAAEPVPAQAAPAVVEPATCRPSPTTLRFLREMHPTAGLEVPPASLSARVPEPLVDEPSRVGQQDHGTDRVDRFSHQVE